MTTNTFVTASGLPARRGPRFSLVDAAVRRTNFWSKLPDGSVAILVAYPERTRSRDTEHQYRQNSDIIYLTGFPEAEAVLIISKVDPKQPKMTMLVRAKDKEQEIWTGIRQGTEGAIANFGADEAFTVDKFDEVVRRAIASAKQIYYRFGVNEEYDEKFRKLWTVSQKPLFNPCTILNEMRLFKTPSEVELMRYAGAVSASAHMRAMRHCRPGMLESELQGELEAELKKYGCSAEAYTSIVANANNACVLHYVDNEDEVTDGALVLIDAAGEYRGYAADITRTFPANGKFSPAQATIYQIVLDAQLAAIAEVKPGVPLQQIHDVAKRVMQEKLEALGILPKAVPVASDTAAIAGGALPGTKALTIRDFFMHGTSHWIGIDVHDVGNMGPAGGTFDPAKGKERVLEPGMAFTIEPGLYLDANDERIPAEYRGIGIRIEDDIVVTAEGGENLTAGVPKSIAEIEALMAEGKSTAA
jgi:Xaa-Pro aminopeptidase